MNGAKGLLLATSQSICFDFSVCKISQNLCPGVQTDLSILLCSASTSLILLESHQQHQLPTHLEDYGSSLVYVKN